MSDLTVRRISSRRDMESFIRLPLSLYSDDSAWVSPLLHQLRLRLSRSAPYFEHAEAAFFLAERDGKAVGRVSAQVCQLAQQHHGKGTGHFGFFESENDQVTAAALLDAASDWLTAQNMTRVMGPFDLSINDEAGMLIEGFGRPPSVFMGHHHSYYHSLLTAWGFQKEIDVYAYYLDIANPYSDRIQRIVQRAVADPRVVVRPIDRSKFDDEMRQLLDIFKEVWVDNWGFIPPTQTEVEHLIRSIKQLLNRGSVMLSEVDGELAGFMVVLPNLNEWTDDLNGKLLPLGWIRLLWRLRFAACHSVRVPLMGLRQQFQRTRLGASVALAMIDRCRQDFLPQGVTHCEMSWILENNLPMRSILEASGAVRDKTYRLYGKSLVSAADA